MRIVFMGTPDFAVPCLEALIAAGHEIALVVTQPDKPAGRSRTLKAPAVKELAVSRGIEVFQPESVKTEESVARLRAAGAEVFVVVAYGKILPKSVLDLPERGCINVHASLLPRHRGAAPIQWSIAAGDSVTGVTTMLMDAGLDTGDMLLCERVDITDADNGETLHDKLSAAGSRVLVKTLAELEAGDLKPIKQREELSCYAPMITKENTKIDFTRPVREVYNLIRAMNPFPGAYCVFRGRNTKLISARVSNKAADGECGEITEIKPDAVCVSCRDGVLEITGLQVEGKKRMSAEDYLRGNRVDTGERME